MAGEVEFKFAEALEASDRPENQRHVLLGNGFSMDWDATYFGYGSLADIARFEGLSVGKQELFAALDTTDFERIADYLNSGAALVRLHRTVDQDYAGILANDAHIVKKGLATAIAENHPDSQLDLAQVDVDNCRAFLSNFGQVFSANYDLLLYWVVVRQESQVRGVPQRDGFEFLTADCTGDLLWKRSPTQESQQVHFLHGALHLYQERREDGRETYVRKLQASDGRLVDQIRKNLDDGVFPLLVTEGRSVEKRQRISASEYLRVAHERLAGIAGSLFIHGLSFSDNDEHILEPLESAESKVSNLYVSVYGDAESRANKALMARVKGISQERSRNHGGRLDVDFYDAASAHVWR